MKTNSILLKNVLLMLMTLSFAATSFAKTYYIYTAVSNGNWTNSATWIQVVRLDGISKDKFIIPSPFVVTADNDVNTQGYTDVEIQIGGMLQLGSPTTINFGNNSKIEIFSTGSINGNGASQVINIGSVAKYVGNKNKNLAGPLVADNSTGVAPSGFAAFSSLAVHFISFTATKNNDNTIDLRWSTSEEENNNRFELEQSINGSSWTKVATVAAVTNNSTIKAYSFHHHTIATGFISYRLKQIDNDGRYMYSTVVAIRDNNTNTLANIYASNKNIYVAFNAEMKSTVAVRVMNMNGDVVAGQSFNKPSSKLTLNINQLQNGIYVVVVTASNTIAIQKGSC